jgi:hypothetical protein
MPGPIRKRDAERRRRNKDGIETVSVDLDTLIAGEVEVPVPPKKFVPVEIGSPDEERDDLELEGDQIGYWTCAWHSVAEEAYWSLARSGQSIFMEPSDWMTAYAMCEMLSRELKPKPMITTDADGATTINWILQPVNGAVMNAFLKGWASLMATEGDRRKLRIELERKKARDAAIAGDGKVVSITQNREDVFKRGARG